MGDGLKTMFQGYVETPEQRRYDLLASTVGVLRNGVTIRQAGTYQEGQVLALDADGYAVKRKYAFVNAAGAAADATAVILKDGLHKGFKAADVVKFAIPAVAAKLEVEGTADNSDILFTAVTPGTGGNAIKVSMVAADAANQALVVDLVGDTVVINLATGGDKAIKSIASEVIAAVNASLEAKALIVASNLGESTGVGVVAAKAATALAGGANAATGSKTVVSYDETTGTLTVSAAWGAVLSEDTVIYVDDTTKTGVYLLEDGFVLPTDAYRTANVLAGGVVKHALLKGFDAQAALDLKAVTIHYGGAAAVKF